jgi:amino acid transporter
MSYDRAMFQFLLHENRFTKTNHWIIVIFFALCSSMMLILGESVNNLSGVYTIAFITVMFLFAFGDLMLKYKRGRLRRTSRAQKTAIFICMLGCIIALVANITSNPEYVKWFIIYYSACAAVVLIMLLRVKIINV